MSPSSRELPGLRCWIWVQRAKCFVCVPAKNGTTSLRVAIAPESATSGAFWQLNTARGFGPWTPEEVAVRDGRKLLSIREPVDRFYSFWRHVRKGCRRPARENVALGLATPSLEEQELAYRSPTALMQYIRAFPMGNFHWYPQSVYLVPGVELVRFDCLLDVLGMDKLVENHNPMSRDDPEMPADLIRAHYARDMELWQSV